MIRRLGAAGALLLAACATSPCRSGEFFRFRGYSRQFVGRWTVARGDSLTIPVVGDRFTLARFSLDSDTVRVGRECRFRGSLVFTVPRDTLAVTWFGQPDQALVFGWPDSLGPFGGIGLSWWGRDSLRGTLLFDESVPLAVRPGTTARFVAGRARAAH